MCRNNLDGANSTNARCSPHIIIDGKTTHRASHCGRQGREVGHPTKACVIWHLGGATGHDMLCEGVHKGGMLALYRVNTLANLPELEM